MKIKDWVYTLDSDHEPVDENGDGGKEVWIHTMVNEKTNEELVLNLPTYIEEVPPVMILSSFIEILLDKLKNGE